VEEAFFHSLPIVFSGKREPREGIEQDMAADRRASVTA
jgi:hypothetical protein